jgi:hypothetical protein
MKSHVAGLVVAASLLCVHCSPRIDVAAETDSGQKSAPAADAPAGDAPHQVETAQCSVPASREGANDAGTCTTGRAYLRCQLTNGDTELCLSDDLSRCPSESSGVDAQATSCTDDCNSDEYAVTCGEIGPNGFVGAPAGCRSIGTNPGGITTACCPCGTTTTTSDASSDSGSLPACSWPARTPDAGDSQCFPGRALVSCGEPNGGGEIGLTDGGVLSGKVPGPCTQECHPDEYALACDLVQPGSTGATPPSGCRTPDGNVATPEVQYVCCPCNSAP